VAVDRFDILYMVLFRIEGSLLAGDALSRRTLQDMVFIAQSWGLPLEYEFTFSLKGPHSNGLLPDILHVQAKSGTYARRTKGVRLRPEVRRDLESLKAFIDDIKEDRRQLHLVASVMFLGGRLGLGRRRIVEHFRNYAPEYFPFEIAEVIELVNATGRMRIR
jgi:hypothetical protein